MGLDALDDPASFPRFLASRLTYRRLGRHAWVLALPLVAAVLLRLPFDVVRQAHVHVASASPLALFFVLATVLGLLLVATVAVLLVRGTWQALAGVALEPGATEERLARPQRRRPGAGPGTGHRGPRRVDHRPHPPPGAGVPGRGLLRQHGLRGRGRLGVARPAGGDRGAVVLPGAPPGGVGRDRGRQRAARPPSPRPPRPSGRHRDRAAADPAQRRYGPARGGRRASGRRWPTSPSRRSWPPSPTAASGRPAAAVDRRVRRVRRWAAGLVAAAGVLSLVSALLAPDAPAPLGRAQLVPLAVPQAANALVALAGLGLLVLARSVRRGQRRAWLIAEALLGGSFILHLVKGIDVEEACGRGAGVRLPASQPRRLSGRGGQALDPAGTVDAGYGALCCRSWRAPPRSSWAPGWRAAATISACRCPRPSWPPPSAWSGCDRPPPRPAGRLLRPGHAGHRHWAGPGGGIPPVTARGGPSRERGGRGRAVLGPGGRGAIRPSACRGPVTSCGATGRARSTTSPCARTSSFSSGASRWWPTASTAGCAWSRLTRSGPPPSARRCGRRSGASPTPRAGPWRCSGRARSGCPIYRGAGMHDLYVGDEAVVDCTRFTTRRRPVQGAAPGGQPGGQVRLHHHLPRPGDHRVGAAGPAERRS